MPKNNVLHISTECYPMAKAGGMADVVGSLPKYLSSFNWDPTVITPRYMLPWFEEHDLEVVFRATLELDKQSLEYNVLRLEDDVLPFEYFCVDIPGLFDRQSIYLNEDGHGFEDEAERNISFQLAVLQWLLDSKSKKKFNVIHCHDHQTGFIPFLIKNAPEYEDLSGIPSFYTIHNGAYNSKYPWGKKGLFPEFDSDLNQFIEWDGEMDGTVAAVRYSDHVNTVSPSYLEDLRTDLPILQLISEEHPEKFSGNLNGIDSDVWNPKTDHLLQYPLKTSVEKFKKENKQAILSGLYHLAGIPLISFIGRFAHQKGGDLLVPSIERTLARFGFVNFYILGSGDRFIEHQVQALRDKYPERIACYVGYNEGLAHQVYGASDFIVMPSRFEPCGLNQMFAMRYGSLVVARKTGGLKDTVIDYKSEGLGISFDYDSIEDLTHALARALHLYRNQELFKELRKKAMKIDFSWTHTAQEYSHIYNRLIEKV